MATVADFRENFPEFASSDDYTDVYLTRMLNFARKIHSIDDIISYWCLAHLVALDAAEGISAADSPALAVDGGSGVITEEQTGPSKAKYRVQSDPFFARTSYGRMFLTLESRSGRVNVTAKMVS